MDHSWLTALEGYRRIPACPIGAPLSNADGSVLGAVSFDALSIECSKAEAEGRYAPSVVHLATVISSSLS